MVNVREQKRFEGEFKSILDSAKESNDFDGFKLTGLIATNRKKSEVDISKLISCSENYYEDLSKIYFDHELVAVISKSKKIRFNGNGILYLIVEKDSILELEYISKKFNSSFVKILVKKDVNLNVILYSDSKDGWNNVEFILEECASAVVNEILFGAKLFHVSAKLEKDSKYDLKSAYFLKGSNSYILNKVIHLGENSFSNIDVRGAAVENSKVISEGLANIKRDAIKSSANQNLKGLILDNTSSISGEPTLKIDNSQVKCSHGFSVSQIAEDILFYMGSRGISKDEAIWLVVGGFFEIGDLGWEMGDGRRDEENRRIGDKETKRLSDEEIKSVYEKYRKLIESKF